MTTITVDLLREEAWDLLRQLERLAILRIQKPKSQPLFVEPSMEVKDFLLNGLPEREDFDAWISDWEANRQDRVLPFKENS